MGEIRKHHEQYILALKNINESINLFNELAEDGNQRDAKTLQTLNEICGVANAALQTGHAFATSTSMFLQNIALCMIPLVEQFKEDAIRQEDFEKAHECSNILYNLQQLINNKTR